MITTPLGPGKEFDRIRAIAAAVEDVLGPIGDDTAPIPSGRGQLVVSTDTSVEGAHFRREWLKPEELGWRAAASALSDLAAAGASPAGITVALVIPPDIPEHHPVDVMKGVANVMRAYNGVILGGDLSAGPCWMVTVTVFGYAEQEISRRGAKPGDQVWVTGTLGGARAAVQSWIHGIEPGAPARLAFSRPTPRIACGKWLAAHGATAMIDISDGVAGDAGHIAAASGVGLAITLDSLPINPAVLPIAPLLDQSPALLAGLGGEDYELLVTTPASWHSARDFESATGTRITLVGKVISLPGVHLTLHAQAVDVGGYSHPI